MGFLEDAARRARRRRSPWNLLLIPATVIPWLTAWWLSAGALGCLYRLVHPTAAFGILPDAPGGILMAVGPMFAWLPAAMVVGNLLVRAVPPARRTLDAEAASVPGTDIGSANRGLLRAATVLVPLGLAVALLGLFV